jgi:hypothetical protein
MDTGDTFQPSADPSGDHGIRCVDCAAALRSPGRETVSFLLLDQLTVPLVGCEDHLEEFSAVCELATEDSARLLDHRPAGGLPCPGCRNAAYDTQQAVVPVGNGGLGLLVCSNHRSDVLSKFRAGLQVRQQLDASLDGTLPDT